MLVLVLVLKNSPSIGTGTVTVKNDPRVLPLGRLLRKTKINELPQLFNILIGDMSLVGPRPQTQRCFDAFPEASQARIVQVRPGLSGIGSIVFRDEEDMMHASGEPERFYDEVIMPYKGRLEEWFVVNQGLWTYLMCILVTIWVVFFPRSPLVWRVFPTLPVPPAEIAKAVNWPAATPHRRSGECTRASGRCGGLVYLIRLDVPIFPGAWALLKAATVGSNGESFRPTFPRLAPRMPALVPAGRRLHSPKSNFRNRFDAANGPQGASAHRQRASGARDEASSSSPPASMRAHRLRLAKRCGMLVVCCQQSPRESLISTACSQD